MTMAKVELNKRDAFLYVRMSPKYKKVFVDLAKENGFNTLSSYMEALAKSFLDDNPKGKKRK
jgi:hypothetical protein